MALEISNPKIQISNSSFVIWYLDTGASNAVHWWGIAKISLAIAKQDRLSSPILFAAGEYKIERPDRSVVTIPTFAVGMLDFATPAVGKIGTESGLSVY